MSERKIVINRCFGEFSLSAAAVRRYAELKGWKTATNQERTAYNASYALAQIYGREIPRDDPDLVRTVEELGSEADGECAKLGIVSIPTDVSWELDDYGGRETIREAHRSWS